MLAANLYLFQLRANGAGRFKNIVGCAQLGKEGHQLGRGGFLGR